MDGSTDGKQADRQIDRKTEIAIENNGSMIKYHVQGMERRLAEQNHNGWGGVGGW